MSWLFNTEPLGANHNRRDLTCGVDELDRYFHQLIGQDRRRSLIVPYVLLDSGTNAVIGYYTLSSSSLLAGRLSAELRRRLPRYESFPAILIGRLAVDQRYKGQGFGGILLVDALQRCLEASQRIGIMAVVVDAQDRSARSFYMRFGFRSLEDHENHMYLPITDIERP